MCIEPYNQLHLLCGTQAKQRSHPLHHTEWCSQCATSASISEGYCLLPTAALVTYAILHSEQAAASRVLLRTEYANLESSSLGAM